MASEAITMCEDNEWLSHSEVPEAQSPDVAFTECAEQYEIMGRTLSVDGELAVNTALRSHLLQVLEHEQRDAAFGREEREASGEKKAALREEADTWLLIQFLLSDVLRSHVHAREMTAPTGVDIPDHRMWAVSHRKLLSTALTSDANLRRSVLVLIWLERVYSDACRDQNRVQYVPKGYRTHTGQLAAQQSQACPLTGRRLVSALDLDATSREEAYLHQADEEGERALFSVIFKHIRCGQIAAARDLCVEKGHYSTAALLLESFENLQHIPESDLLEVPPDLLPNELVNRCHINDTSGLLCPHRFSLHAALLELARDKRSPGGAHGSAVFGALTGQVDCMLSGMGPTPSFQDTLWAHLRGNIEHSLHNMLRSSLQSHDEYNDADAQCAIAGTTPQHAHLSEFAAGACRDDSSSFAHLQAAIIQLFGESMSSPPARFVTVFQLLHDVTSAHAPRLAAHLAMQLWRCRSLVMVEFVQDQHDQVTALMDSILTQYAHHICKTHPQTESLLAIVPYLASKAAGAGAGVRMAAEFCVVLGEDLAAEEADALRSKLIKRLQDLGVDVHAVLSTASRILIDPADAADVLFDWTGCTDIPKAGPSARAEEAVRLLTYHPAQAGDALTAFNEQCRGYVRAMAAHTRAIGDAARKPELQQAKLLDQLVGERAQCVDDLRSLFARVYTLLQDQFKDRIIREQKGTAGYAHLVTERMEAQHWEVYLDTELALNAWREVYGRRPQVDDEEVLGAVSVYDDALNTARTQRTQRLTAEWVMEEATVREAFRDAVPKMLSRQHVWLRDLQSVSQELSAEEAQIFFATASYREDHLSALRKLVIPGVVEAVLEMAALRADHLAAPVAEKEHALCMTIVDALVTDSVTESESLMDSFTDVFQASRIAAYIARIDAGLDA